MKRAFLPVFALGVLASPAWADFDDRPRSDSHARRCANDQYRRDMQ